MTSLLGMPRCWGYPERDERPTTLEYVAAELWVREHYRKWFQEKGGDPQIITWQYERFFESYTTNDGVLDLAMQVLEADYNNVFTDSVRRRFAALVAKGATQAELYALLREAGPGGARKPDMLGISNGNALLFDSLEVGTVKTAESTYKELREKMATLNHPVLPLIKSGLPIVQAKAAARSSSARIPTEFVVRGSPFQMKEWARVLPLPVRITGGIAKEIDWICYHPTETWRPREAAPGAPQVDGMVLYHIHRAPMPQLPARVRSHLESEFRKWERDNSLVLELNPAFNRALMGSRSDWSPEARRLFGYMGIGALVILGTIVAAEMGLFVVGAAAIEGGLWVLAQTPAAVLTALRGAAAVASRLWPAAVGAGPTLMPAFAQ